jgi:valyl-tRNA synthetase
LILALGEVVALPKERERLGKEIDKLDAELAKIVAKLANANFLAKARPEVVEEQRERQVDVTRDRDRLRAAYDRLTAG